MIKIPEHRKGLTAIIVAALLWSTGGIFIKLVTLNAYQLSAIRSFFAASVFLLLFRKDAIKGGWFTILNAIFYSGILILFVVATKLTTAANAIFLQYTAPIYVLLLEPLLLKTKLERINVITIVLCFAGMSLFFVGKISAGHMTGNLIALLSGVSFAAFLLGLRKNKPEYQFSSIFWGNVIIAVVCLPEVFNISEVLVSDFLMTAFLGIFQIGIAYAFFSYGLKKVLAIEASLISMIEPVLNPVWVYLGYGEQPSLYAIAGGIIILLTIAGRTLYTERRNNHKTKTIMKQVG